MFLKKKKVTRFPWTCKLAFHSFGITSLKAILAISGCGYCSHHRVTSEMWVRSWHQLPACWVISLSFGMCCFASAPSPFPLRHVFYLGFLICVFLMDLLFSCVYLWVDLLSSWLGQAHQNILHPRVDFINFSFEIITSVGERPAGEGLRSLCFVLGCQDICLLRLYMSRQHWEPRRKMGKFGSDSLNQGGLGRCCLNWLFASWTQ